MMGTHPSIRDQELIREMHAFLDRVRDAVILRRIRTAARQQGALESSPRGIPYERHRRGPNTR